MEEPHQALVDKCLANDLQAQKELYQLFASRMLAVCNRYAYDLSEAEDILQEGFIKVFTQLHKYLHKGSLEGWVRRIMVNTAIDHVRRERKFRFQQDLDTLETKEMAEENWDHLEHEDLFNIIQELPDGYRIIFNMYAIEGYAHKDIAAQLGIKASTSRSQYMRARAILQQKIRLALMERKTYGNAR